MNTPHLSPDALDLVEADAERLFIETTPAGREPMPWSKCPDHVRNVFRAYARNPYRSEDQS